MFKDVIKCKDLEGNDVERTVFFNLNKAEWIRWGMLLPLNKDGKPYESLKDYLEAVLERDDRFEIVSVFDEIVRRSYGVKAPDGIQFIKSDEEYLKFYNSDCYSEFFMKLLTEEGYVQKFVNCIVPQAAAAPSQT